MKTLLLGIPICCVLIFFSGCGDTPTITKNLEKPIVVTDTTNADFPTDYRYLYISPDTEKIKPIQLIKNETELNALFDLLNIPNKFVQPNFAKDVVLVIKRLTNLPLVKKDGYYRNLTSMDKTLENDSIRITHKIYEIAAEVQDANATIDIVLLEDAVNTPIYLTKNTHILSDIKAFDLYFSAEYDTVLDPRTESVSLSTVKKLNSITPFFIFKNDEIQEYEERYGFDLSSLSLDELKIPEIDKSDSSYTGGNYQKYIFSSGYYVSSDSQSSYNSVKFAGIHASYIPNIDLIFYEHVFGIQGVRSDCHEKYTNDKEALFYANYEMVYENTPFVFSQHISLKSCSNLQTVNLNEFDDWFAEPTWQMEK